MDVLEIIKSEKPTLINFFATWCGPCHAMKPNLDQAAAHYGERINYERIDVDEYAQLSGKFGIRSIPTTILFKNNEIVWKHTGVYPGTEIIKRIGEHITVEQK